MKVKIDPEFSALIPPVADPDDAELEREVLADGRIIEPLVLWNHQQTLLDGHRRHKLMLKHPTLKAPTPVVLVLESRQDAHDWIIRHQLSKRNVTKEQKDYLTGKLYNSRKSAVPNPSGTNQHEEVKYHSDTQPKTPSTSEQIAQEQHIGVATVKRAGKFAEHVDAIAETAPEVKQAVLNGTAQATRADVAQAAALPPEQLAKVAERVKSGKSLKDALPKKPKPGRPIVDVRKFQKVKANVGKLVREMTDLKEHAGGASFHSKIRSHLNEILSTLTDWQKQAVK